MRKVGAVILASFAFAGCEQAMDAAIDREVAYVEKKVAEDSIAQYETAAAAGSAMDKCVYAGFVVAAFIQAKDAENAAKWKAVERADCKAAGIPSQ